MSLCTPRLTSPFAPLERYNLTEDRFWNACAVPHRPGQFLLAGACSLILVDAKTRKIVRDYSVDGEEIMCVAPVTDDGVFVCGGDNGRLHFFHVDHDDEIAPVMWRSGDDKKSEDDEGGVDDEAFELVGFGSQISAVATSPCGGKIACGARSDSMRILCVQVERDIDAEHVVRIREDKHESEESDLSVAMGATLVWSPDGLHLLFVDEEDRVCAAVADTLESVAQVGGDRFSSVAVSPSGRYIALAGRRSIIVVEGIEGVVKSAAASTRQGSASQDASSFVLMRLDGVCASNVAFVDELVLAVCVKAGANTPPLQLFSIPTGRCIDRVGTIDSVSHGCLALGAPKSKKRGGGATTVHQRDVLVSSLSSAHSFSVFRLEQDEVTEAAAENDGEGDVEVSTRRKRVD